MTYKMHKGSVWGATLKIYLIKLWATFDKASLTVSVGVAAKKIKNYTS